MPKKAPASHLIISGIPRELASPEELGKWITMQIQVLMESRLRASERDIWRHCLEGDGEGDLPPRLLVEMDELIIAKVPSLGWRITYSPLVQMRLRHWELAPNGEDLMRRFAEGLPQWVRILQRRELPPLDPDLGFYKKATVCELRVILRAIHGPLSSARRPLNLAEQFALFAAAIAENDAPHLQANLASWEYFFTHGPQDERAEIMDMIYKGRAADLFNAWLSRCTGYTRETLRQKISALKSQA